jgi:hypothetical protein
MKIRRGFVSNSSSSSFLIAYAKVKLDKIEEFYKWFRVYDKAISCLHVLTKEKVATQDINWPLEYVYTEDDIPHYNIESFNTSLSFTFEKDDDLILYFSYQGHEGDGAFEIIRRGYHDMDYDIDLNFFKPEIQAIIEEFSNNDIFKDNEYVYGAGRDG